MQPNHYASLRQFDYDPLDRLVASTSSAQATALRFYQKERLANEIQGSVQRSMMQHDDQLLAQRTSQGSTAVETSLLATDPQRSVLNVVDATQPHRLAYTPYGYRPLGHGLLSLLGFNGERPDPVTGCYLLGTGYHRPFHPVLGRFICPDSWSPFGRGGLNAYAYCGGDPVNKVDPTGHIPSVLKPLLRTFGIIRKQKLAPVTKRNIHTLVPPVTIRTQDASYELVGFHGTSAVNARKIPQTGLDPSYMKPGFFGEGFYTTPSKSKALNYTEPRRGTSYASDPDGMLAVYVKDPTRKIQGRHYTFHPGTGGALDELLLRPEIYSDVRTLQFRPTLATHQPNVREIFNMHSEIRSR